MLYAWQHAGEKGMNGFTLELHDANHAQRVDDVVSFVGEDASGSFGLQAGHARFMTMLSLLFMTSMRFLILMMTGMFLVLASMTPCEQLLPKRVMIPFRCSSGIR